MSWVHRIAHSALVPVVAIICKYFYYRCAHADIQTNKQINKQGGIHTRIVIYIGCIIVGVAYTHRQQILLYIYEYIYPAKGKGRLVCNYSS